MEAMEDKTLKRPGQKLEDMVVQSFFRPCEVEDSHRNLQELSF